MIKHFMLSILWRFCDTIGSKVVYFRAALATFVGVLGWLYPSWTQAQIVTPTISALESRCQASGKVVVTGEATYLYSLTGGNIPGQLGPFDGPNVTFELLAPGNYTLTVIDPATNDEKTFPVSVTGNYQQNWTFTAAVSYLPCTGTAPTVSIGSLAITGATTSQQRPDYFFRISTKNGTLPADGTVPPPYDTTLGGSFPIVYPAGMGGTYEIQGRDSCGNYKTIKVTVPSSIPAPTASSSFVKFNNCDGDAEYKITASGGNAPYIFKVKSGPNQVGNEITDPTSATFTLTAGGTYVISVTDQCGGTRDVTVTPKAYTSPTTSVGTSVGICGAPGDNGTGSIRLTTTASSVGIGPLTYTLTSVSCGVNISVTSSNFDTTFINLPRPCTYTVEVKDGCNKINTRTVELTGPGPHSMGCSKAIQCPSGVSEQYRLQMSVSVRPPYNPTPNYTFVIKDSTTNTVVYTSTQSSASYTSSGLAPGKYYLSITDACGAMCTDSIIIGTYANPTVSVDATNQCFGSGQANVIGINNRGPENGWNNIYTYRIIAPSASRVNEGPESDSPTHTGQFSSLVSGGSYTFSFNDGCKTVTTQVTIPTYTQPTWEVGFGALCGNATVANLQIMNLQPEGQILGPYKWRIIGTDSQLYGSTAPYNGTLPYPNSMGQTDSVFVGLPAKNLAGEVATYQILGNDGCKNSYQGSGKIGALPAETLLLNTTTVCADGSTLLRARVSTPIVGGTYRYYRNGVKVAESNKLFTNIVPALPGTYTVKVVASTLPDSSCVQEASEVVVQASATLVTTDPAPVCPGVFVNLTNTTAGSSSGTITFYRDKNLTQEETNPTAVTTAQTYYVKLVPTGINNCVLIDSIVVANKICVGSIGDYVWKDANDNGIQDNNEQGVPGVIVQLLNATNNNVLATDTTNASGLYGFPNLQSGTYKVKILVSSLPDTCQITPKSNVNTGGGNDTNDSDFDSISGESPVITIDVTGSGLTKDNPTIDAGLYVPCVKPSAGANQTLCVGTTTIDLKDASALEAWSKGTQPASTNAIINASSGVVTGLTIAGDYYFILTYKGQAACSDTVKVTVNPRPAANVTAKIQAICLGDTPAAYTASPSTGVGYAWYGPLVDTTASLGTAIGGQTTASFTPSGAAINTIGTKYYAVIVTDPTTSCQDTAFATLTVKALPVAQVAVKQQSICLDATPVAYVATPTTGVGYIWYGPLADTTSALGTAIAGQITASFTPSGVALEELGTHYYAVVITDNITSCKDTAYVSLTIFDKPAVENSELSACENESGAGIGTFNLSSLNNTVGGSNKVEWFSNVQRTTPIANPAAYLSTSGNVYVLVTNETTGCSDTTFVTLTVNTKPNAGTDSTGVKAICNDIATVNLPDAAVGESWAQLGSSPKAVTINATTGVVTGMDAIGTYRFVLTNSNTNCADTVNIEVKNCLKGSLGDYVWKDTNDNGIQDANENGVAGVIVQLLNGDTNALISTDTTDTSGAYGFTGLDSGNYKVKIVLSSIPAACQISTKKDAGSPNDDTKDSDFDPTTGESPVIVINTLSTGIDKDNPTIDAALVVPCVKPTFTLTTTPTCSPDVQTYSITFSVANKNGTLKVDKGIISGNNPYTVTDIPSGATIKITDSLSAICKFDTLIVGPNCNCNPNVPTIITPNLTACEGDTFPTLKATVFGLATVEWYATPTGGSLLHTGLSFKPEGIVLGDTIFYAQARSTDPACLTDISSSRVAVTIDVNCLKEVDLALKKLISKKIASIGDTIEYKLKVWNEADFDATGVVVTDSLNAGIQYISSSAVRVAGGSAGSYNPSTYQWNIGNMAANGDTVVLTIRVKVLAHGVWFNTAEITATNEKDRDSTPGNGSENEDDLDRQCFTVPFKLCTGEKVEVSVPAQYTNVQWFKQGSGAIVGTGNLILLEEPGTYTYTASNSTCPAEGCCPVIIEPGDNCCPTELCIPFSIKKIKKTSL